ncbi:hypothetical protein [Aeoliella sp.]|uniref:hypothetical protein n=1 Tax=Aeoliella sp. TaxID=2795800 RepID=UPI003CCC23D5
MAKRKAAPKKKSSKPDWQTKWPRTRDLKAWYRCMIKKCDAIADPENAASTAHLPIEHLAEMGEVSEALRHVNRFLRRLPEDEVLETVRMAELGAEIALNAGDEKKMEKYLAKAEAMEAYITRKCDANFAINSVREFRALNGILDPDEAVGDWERSQAQFRGAQRRFRLGLASRKRKAAADAAKEMEAAAKSTKDQWARQCFLQGVLETYAKLKDTDAVKRCIRSLDRETRDEVLDAHTLLDLGMKKEAIARAKRTIKEELEELAESDDPNIHFPVNSICDSLELLVDQGEANTAKRWLQRTFREMPEWYVYEVGWTTSAVYTQLAKVATKIEGPKAGQRLVEKAMEDAGVEHRRDFAKGAQASAVAAQADIAGLDQAIETARKIRSKPERRRQLGALLARAGRWKEMAEVLSEVASPEEAASVCWCIKFDLPGGKPR